MPKKYLRRRRVAERYDTTPRNVDRWVAKGILPPPDLKDPKQWSESTLDKHDKRRAVAEA